MSHKTTKIKINKMKGFLIFVCLTLPLVSIAQFVWEELPIHNAEQIRVIHVTKDDRIIGYYEYNGLILQSFDVGESWEFLADVNVLENFSNNFNELIIERNDGALFVSIREFIYEIDEINKKLELFFEPDLFFPHDAFFFLENDELIVTNTQYVQRYSNTGVLISSIAREESGFSRKLIKGPEDFHFIYDTNGLSKFSTDLSYFEENISELYTSSTFTIDSNSRLFINSMYSTDGFNWVSYPNGVSGLPIINNEDKLILLGQDTIYLFNDDISNYTAKAHEIEHSLFYNIDRLFNLSNSGLIFTSTSCPGALWHSLNDLDEWQNLSEKLLVGNPFAFYVEATNLSSVNTKGCKLEEFFVLNNNSWENQNIDSQNNCDYFNETISFPNGTLLSDFGCISKDEGLTWQVIEGLFLFDINGIEINASGIYLFNHFEILKSTNLGATWESIPIDNTNFSIDNTFDDFAISVSELIYSPSPSSLDHIMFTYDLNGNIVEAIESLVPNATFRSIVASHNTDVVFMHLNSGTSYSKLMIYEEGTESRTLRSFPVLQLYSGDKLYVDHDDNLYLMTSNQLFVSPDQGDSWQDISPNYPVDTRFTDVDVSWDGYVYLSSIGAPILKSKSKVVDELNVFTNELHSSDIKVFPVPSNDFLNVEYSGSAKITDFMIIDVNGKQLMKGSAGQSFQIDVSDLNSNIYLLSLKSETNLEFIERILVVR